LTFELINTQAKGTVITHVVHLLQQRGQS